MPKRCKNPLMTVTATIAYYMELQGLTNKYVYEKLMISDHTWQTKKKNPEKFTLEDLSMLAKILGIDIVTIVSGLIPKEKGTVKNE